MSERIHGLAQLLPNKKSFEDCSLEELQHITERFPYFAPAQFLLLQKLKETGSPHYEAQHRKAVLYFHEPLLFDYFNSADKFFMDETVFDAAENVAALPQEQTGEKPPITAPSTEDEVSFIATETSTAETAPEMKSKKETQSSLKKEFQSTSELPPPYVQVAPEEVPALTESDKVKDIAQIEPAEPVVLPVLPLQESPQLAAIDDKPEQAMLETRTAAMTVAPPSAVVLVAEDKSTPAENVAQATGETAKAAATKMQGPQQVTANESLAFEPFHTVDYFASQGIKISSDALPKDKLSHQLRSFTEWLKVMKRLPTTEMEAAPQTSAEKTVESLASHSVEGSDVVTEAMAEVWARQGNRKKAIETYNKLSLLNPSKKAYFAAKIENLSGT